MKMRYLSLAIALLATGCVAPSCTHTEPQSFVAPPAKAPAEAEIPILKMPGTDVASFKSPEGDEVNRSIVFNQGARWPNPKSIPQCWVNPEEAGEIVGDLQNYLSAEYAKVGMGFQFQGKCNAGSYGQQMIRTWFKRTHTWNTNGGISGGGGLSFLGALGGGAQLGGVEGNGTMNVQISRDVTGYATNNWRQWTINVTRATTVHEFGHALGLAHEQERNDAPQCGDIRGNLANGGAYVFVGRYDPLSIMNYCKDPANISSLSAGDLDGLRYLYQGTTTTPPPVTPPPATGGQPKGSYTIRVKTNKCLDVAGNGTAGGTQVQQWDCNGTTAQSFWALDGGNGTFQFKGTNSNRCLDVWGNNTANGARLKISDCHGGLNQKFKLEDKGGGWYALRAQNSQKCIDVDLGGGYAQQWDCNPQGQINQSFGFFQVGASQIQKASMPIAKKK